MINHHPPDEYLVQYAGGSLEEGPALVVAGHLNFCPACRAVVRDAERVGGALLEQAAFAGTIGEPAALPEQATLQARALAAADADSDVPFPLRQAVGRRLGDIRWRTFWPGMQTRKVKAVTADADIRLLRLYPGKGLPIHTHDGDELTLVLKGSFSDDTGRYALGDIALGNPSLTHQPIADGDEPCICLVAVEAPLRFRFWRARLAAKLLYR